MGFYAYNPIQSWQIPASKPLGVALLQNWQSLAELSDRLFPMSAMRFAEKTDSSRLLDDFSDLGAAEVLEHDPRPTFVLDLDPDKIQKAGLNDAITPVFCNEALRLHHRLLDAVVGDGVTDEVSISAVKNEFQNFRNWATSVTKFDDSKDVYPLTFEYQNLMWTGSTVRKRWRLISGNRCFDRSRSTDLAESLPQHGSGSDWPVATQNAATISKTTSPFKALDFTSTPNDRRDGISQNGRNATVSDLRDASVVDHAILSTRSSTGPHSSKSQTITLSVPMNGVPDWTAAKIKGPMSEHLSFFRRIDWKATPLGDMRKWSRELRQTVNLVMVNPHPAAIFWGSEMTTLYNEAYSATVAGNKHPTLMGTGMAGPFSETWDAIEPLFAECARTGESIDMESQQFFLDRRGFLEETFFTWSFSPLYGGTSRIVGFYNAPFETTATCIGQRRTQTLQKLGESIAKATNVNEFWKHVVQGLEDNGYDVPFAILYAVVDSDDIDTISSSSGSAISLKSCILQGSLAIPKGHPAAPYKLDLRRSREGFVPSFREAMRTREPTKLQLRDGTLPEALLEGIEWRGHGDPCKEAVIVPLRPTSHDTVLAFLVLGLNPRRPYDEDYQTFFHLIGRQIATALASVLLFEDEISCRKAELANAAAEQNRLNQQLAMQKGRLQRMTALSPLGMYCIDPDGVIVEANDRYYEMTSESRTDLYAMCWMNQLTAGSQSAMAEGWKKLTQDLQPWTSELQLNKIWTDPHNEHAEPMEYWVLANSYPELSDSGELVSVMGSITDISHLKWAQGLQERRLREAEETRRQQNEFMDITSHEMRNPLSAILQCADDIIASMTTYQKTQAQPLIDDCLESAKIIAVCVQHQKSIVDDILTVSKLDSNLIVLTPTVVQPVSIVRQTLKIFDSELIVKGIDFKFVVHPSFGRLGVDWALLDTGRVAQIIINFMTNAIKFTSDRQQRAITVSMGVSLSPPISTNTLAFDYIPRNTTKTAGDVFGPEWNHEDTIYIRCKVQDTGCGLTREEKQRLFRRFQQASPRTHAQYGGSGLGLFISRQLTELHGGQIGVASEADIGSTFGFFITAKKAKAPDDQESTLEDASLAKSLQAFKPIDKDLVTRTKSLKVSGQDVKPSLKSPVPPPANPAKLFVLVVEDNIVNQKVLVKQLVKAGCDVSVADDGQKALDVLEKTEFRVQGGKPLSVVFMDLEMPVMDGLTCVRNIRRMEAEQLIQKHVPVIAVTANVRQEQIAVARESGMDDVVSKPFRIPDLLSKVEVLLKRLELTQSASHT